jgi:hypothetical protein
MPAHRALLRAGFLLVLLSLVTGLAIPLFRNARLAVAAHVTSLLGGLLLVGLALAWGAFRLSAVQGRWVRGLFLYGTYTNWGATCLGAAWGTSRLTPVSGAGFQAARWQELVVEVLLVSLVLAMLVGTVMVVYALRPALTPLRETTLAGKG